MKIVDLTIGQESLNSIEQRLGLRKNYTEDFFTKKSSSGFEIFYAIGVRAAIIRWHGKWEHNKIAGVILQMVNHEKISVILVDNALHRILRETFIDNFTYDRLSNTIYEKESFFEMFLLKML